ncbi:MAG: acylphosphatase [Planctomycetota bacterium]
MTAQRREIWYQGDVQGVGFRYTVTRTAQQFAVTGFVRNLSDGRVHLVCEGAAAELDAFLGEIANRMAAFIRDTQEDRRPATGAFSRFEIRH